jgi:helix-turn-helix protein
MAVIATCSRPSDRLVLLALRIHDVHGDGDGATPGYQRLASLTGLHPSTVRKRLGALERAGHLQKRRWGRLAVYYIVAPRVAPRGNMLPPEATSEDTTCSRHVAKLGPQERELKSKTSTRAVASAASQPAEHDPSSREKVQVEAVSPPDAASDNVPAYDAEGRPAPWLTQLAAEAWPGRGASPRSVKAARTGGRP